MPSPANLAAEASAKVAPAMRSHSATAPPLVRPASRSHNSAAPIAASPKISLNIRTRKLGTPPLPHTATTETLHHQPGIRHALSL